MQQGLDSSSHPMKWPSFTLRSEFLAHRSLIHTGIPHSKIPEIWLTSCCFLDRHGEIRQCTRGNSGTEPDAVVYHLSPKVSTYACGDNHGICSLYVCGFYDCILQCHLIEANCALWNGDPSQHSSRLSWTQYWGIHHLDCPLGTLCQGSIAFWPIFILLILC